MTQRLDGSLKSKDPDEVLLVSVDFQLFGLRSGESLTGTPSVIDSTGELTFSNISVNQTAFENERKKSCPAGKGVQFLVSGGTAGTMYKMKVSCSTNGTPAQTLVGHCPIEVRTTD